MNSPHDDQSPRVLIIEDDPGHQILLDNLVKRAGCSCDFANNGRSGVAKACVNDYDLIFADIHMPNLDGYEVAASLRRRGITTPMVAVTGLQFDGVGQIALDAGYDDFLTKPIEQADVSRIIRKYLRTDTANPVL